MTRDKSRPDDTAGTAVPQVVVVARGTLLGAEAGLAWVAELNAATIDVVFTCIARDEAEALMKVREQKCRPRPYSDLMQSRATCLLEKNFSHLHGMCGRRSTTRTGFFGLAVFFGQSR